MKLSRNIGAADRLIRLIVGAALIVLAATGTIGIWGYLGVIFVLTATVNFCPIYKLLGIKTCSTC